MTSDGGVREPGGGLEVVLVAAGVTVMGAGVATWLGAELAVRVAGDGGAVNGGMGDWLTAAARLVRGTPPVEAWAENAVGLPSPLLYWLCTALVAVVAVGVAAGLAIVATSGAAPVG